MASIAAQKSSRGTGSEALFDELKKLLGDRFTTSAAVREHHGKDESYHHPCPPDAVCFPLSTEDVSAIVKACARAGMPVIAFGAGTSLEGHVIPTQGGVSLDMTRMNEVLRVSPEDLDATVQAGVTRKQLNAHLRDTGLFFPVDPGADATLGGMAATRASGTNAVRYGTMRENVLALTVVLADGRIVRTARRARKSSAGYDLTRLFVGSEGTLGIITEVTVRLYGVPAEMAAAVCPFTSVQGAVDTAIEAIQMGIPVARIELVDELLIKAVNNYASLNYEVAPTLFLEFHGSAAAVAEHSSQLKEIVAGHGGKDFRWTVNAEERAKLWRARHDVHYASLAYRPGCKSWSTDVCVPISRLAECIMETKKDMEKASFPIMLVGHVGDGNFHLGLLIDPAKPEELEEAKQLNERLVVRALAMDGTCTGEHGVGLGKRKYLKAEHGEGVELMKSIKQLLDPQGILNPGKVLP